MKMHFFLKRLTSCELDILLSENRCKNLMNDKRKDGKGKKNQPFIEIEGDSGEDIRHAIDLGDEDLQSESKEEGNIEKDIFLLEDIDEAVLDIIHAQHMEDLR